MAINDEYWRVWASGGFNLMLAEMQAISGIDTLARLVGERDFIRWLRVELAAPGSLNFAVSEATLSLLWNQVEQTSAYYAPEMREQEPSLVENAAATGGDTLTADAAPGGYTTMVYSFDGLEFALVGTLTANATPGAGNYVLALHNDSSGAVGLPSLFLTLTS